MWQVKKNRRPRDTIRVARCGDRYLEVLREFVQAAVEAILTGSQKLDVVELGEVQLQQIKELGFLCVRLLCLTGK